MITLDATALRNSVLIFESRGRDSWITKNSRPAILTLQILLSNPQRYATTYI